MKQAFEEEMASWLKAWDEKIRIMAEKLPPDDPFHEKIKEMKRAHEDIRTRLDDLKSKRDDADWLDMKKKVETVVGHIDENFRESLAYFH